MIRILNRSISRRSINHENGLTNLDLSLWFVVANSHEPQRHGCSRCAATHHSPAIHQALQRHHRFTAASTTALRESLLEFPFTRLNKRTNP